MDLDEETLEALGFGNVKAYETLAKAESKYHEILKVSKAIYMKNRYHTNPEARRKHIESVRRWQLLNYDSVKAKVKARRKTSEGKVIYKKQYDKWYAKLKKDPIRWAAYLKAASKRKEKTRAKRKAEKEKRGSNTTTDNTKQP